MNLYGDGICYLTQTLSEFTWVLGRVSSQAGQPSSSTTGDGGPTSSTRQSEVPNPKATTMSPDEHNSSESKCDPSPQTSTNKSDIQCELGWQPSGTSCGYEQATELGSKAAASGHVFFHHMPPSSCESDAEVSLRPVSGGQCGDSHARSESFSKPDSGPSRPKRARAPRDTIAGISATYLANGGYLDMPLQVFLH